MKRTIYGILVFLSMCGGAYAQTYVGTYGHGTEFFVTNSKRDNSRINVSGFFVNQYGVRDDYKLIARCAGESSSMDIQAFGKNFSLRKSDMVDIIPIAPVMGGYFSILGHYCK